MNIIELILQLRLEINKRGNKIIDELIDKLCFELNSLQTMLDLKKEEDEK